MNNSKLITKAAILGILAAVATGCASSKVHFPTVSETDLDLTRGRAITGSASGFQLLLLIPIAINGRQERAYEALKKEAGTDIITDVKIQESWYYGFVGTTYRTTYNATAYPLKK